MYDAALGWSINKDLGDDIEHLTKTKTNPNCSIRLFLDFIHANDWNNNNFISFHQHKLYF